MNEWKKFHETFSPGEKYFYSRLNMEDDTDADYTYRKICKNIEIKHLIEYHDSYVERKTLFLVDIFENQIKKRLDLRK